MFRSTPVPRCAQRNCTLKAPCSLVTARPATLASRRRRATARRARPPPPSHGPTCESAKVGKSNSILTSALHASDGRSKQPSATLRSTGRCFLCVIFDSAHATGARNAVKTSGGEPAAYLRRRFRSTGLPAETSTSAVQPAQGLRRARTDPRRRASDEHLRAAAARGDAVVPRGLVARETRRGRRREAAPERRAGSRPARGRARGQARRRGRLG